MKNLIALLFPFLVWSQVGINTTVPQATLHIAKSNVSKGDLIVEHVEQGLPTDSLLVWRAGKVLRISVDQLPAASAHKCPNLIRSESGGYNLTFKSDYSIPRPNENPQITGNRFVVAGVWIQENKYVYKYSNATGVPLNISQAFSVNFSGLICNY